MSNTWDEYAEEWDSNEDAISYSEEAFKSLSNVIQLSGLNILDFGCGTGLLTEKLSSIANHIVALDASTKMMAVLESKQLPNVSTIAEPLSEDVIREYNLHQSKFDLIVASSVCAFLPDYESTLSLLKSLLVPEGVFVQWDWLSPEDDSDFGFTNEQVESSFKKVGFSLISLTQPFSLTSSKGAMPVLMGVAKNI